MLPITFLALAAVIACFVAFVIILAGKIGLRDRVITTAPKLISELVGCDFCLSFWLSLLIAVILAIFVPDKTILLVPPVSAVIARLLV